MSSVTFHDTVLEAVAGIASGATVMVSGFGSAGQPVQLIEALLESAATDLTIVSNNAGGREVGLAALIREGRVRKVVCSFPRQVDSWHFDEAYRAGRRGPSRPRRQGRRPARRAADSGVMLHTENGMLGMCPETWRRWDSMRPAGSVVGSVAGSTYLAEAYTGWPS